jgi:hypothetical protein
MYSSKKKMKQIYIYRESHLPENGWFQACFDCLTVTSKLKLFDIYKTNTNCIIFWELYIYVCPKCKKELKTDKNKYKIFYNNYKKYIFKNYPQLYDLINLKQLNKSSNIIQKWWKKNIK